jgi:hypothetical protein
MGVLVGLGADDVGPGLNLYQPARMDNVGSCGCKMLRRLTCCKT